MENVISITNIKKDKPKPEKEKAVITEPNLELEQVMELNKRKQKRIAKNRDKENNNVKRSYRLNKKH